MLTLYNTPPPPLPATGAFNPVHDDSDNSSTASAVERSTVSSSRTGASITSHVVRIELGRSLAPTKLRITEATSPVETDPWHPASFANSLYGDAAVKHIERTRRDAAMDEIIGTSAKELGTFGVVVESLPTDITESSMKGHAKRVSCARDAVAAAAASRCVLPERPIINDFENLWSESMIDSVERIVKARLAREAEANAPALRLAKALRRNRKISPSARAKQSEARFLARMLRRRA